MVLKINSLFEENNIRKKIIETFLYNIEWCGAMV